MSNASLFTIADEAQWNKALDSYKKSVTFVQKRKKKDNKLQELDNWYNNIIFCSFNSSRAVVCM